jgi:hypothetical protein
VELPAVSREDLLALANRRIEPIRAYLSWARDNDNGQLRLNERDDIGQASEVAKTFKEHWWGVVIFSCFGSRVGAEAVEPYLQRPLIARELEAVFSRITFPPRSVGHHRRRPALKGAKEALGSACSHYELFHNVLHSRESFEERYIHLRARKLKQWGRTTVFDLLLRAGAMGVGGMNYRPEYAYLAGSTGPMAGFKLVWGVSARGRRDALWAEALLQVWTENWDAVASRVGVSWEKPPLDPCDQENFLCIYHQEHGGKRISKPKTCVPAAIPSFASRRSC